MAPGAFDVVATLSSAPGGATVRVTIKQVAREAGVSIATVSRVWNGTAPVSAPARRRILAVARRLRYVPHVGAQSLITRRTRTVGVLLPELYGEFFSELLRGVDRSARHHGYQVLVSGFHGDPAELEAGLRATRGRVDGLLAVTPDLTARRIARIVPDGLPVVMVASSARGGSPFDTIGIDNAGGAAAVVRHLVALGHRRIAFVKGPERNADARERLEGYRRAVRAVGAEAAPSLEIEGDFREESGGRAAVTALGLDPRPSAMFAANDAMAIGALASLHDAGIAVPGGMALVGFDDVPLARFVTPPLTTVKVSMEELGRRAMERLLVVLAGETGPRHRETLPTSLVVRGSCGAARGGAARKVSRTR
jgi:LacI family transcriptional regulator, galactose operon repressor